jgi:putative holliday junction resolvase
MPTAVNNILALDVGEKRIGVALMRSEVGFPLPLTTLVNDSDIWLALKRLTEANQVGHLVVGLPRNLDGNHTSQTATIEAFVTELQNQIKLPVSLQDEALTSVEAENILRQSGKPYEKADIDAMAASLILADYARSQGVNT